jgi:hypothetical protein
VGALTPAVMGLFVLDAAVRRCAVAVQDVAARRCVVAVPGVAVRRCAVVVRDGAARRCAVAARDVAAPRCGVALARGGPRDAEQVLRAAAGPVFSAPVKTRSSSARAKRQSEVMRRREP